MNFKKWVKSIQTAGYNGACTVSLSRPIRSDHLSIADHDDNAFGAGTLTWQNPVHSWKAGPGKVLTVENKHTSAI